MSDFAHANPHSDPTACEEAADVAGTRVLLRGLDAQPVQVEVDWSDCVAGLSRAVLGLEGGCTIDGAAYPATLALHHLAIPRGATIAAATAPLDMGAYGAVDDPVPVAVTEDHADGPAPCVTVEVVAGPSAGLAIALPVGTHLIGRHPAADVALCGGAVSARHAELTIRPDGSATLRDLGSRNGLDGHHGDLVGPWARGSCVRLGDTVLRLVPVVPTRGAPRPGSGATGVVHRRGVRLRRPEAPKQLPPAPAATTEAHASPLRWSMILLPLLMAVAMSLLIDPRYAMFALLSPVMAVGSWWEDRRHHRRREQGSRSDFDIAERAWRAQARLSLAAAAACRWFDHPGPAAAVQRAAGCDLWSTRPGDPGFAALHVGVGQMHVVQDVAALESGLLVPLVVPVGDGDVVGIIGDPAARVALLRAALAGLVTSLGPDDLQLFPHHPESAEWIWLPHVPDDFILGEDLVAALRRDDGRLRVGIVTPAVAQHHEVRDAVANRRLALIVLTDQASALSDQTSATVTTDGGRLTVSGPEGRRTGIPAELDRAAARLVVDRLRTRVVDDTGSANVPDVVTLGTLLRHAGLVTSDPRGRPRPVRTGGPGLRSVLAASHDGPFTLDLVADGPHVFIGGTTGAGKSELLRSLVLSLAVSHGPEEVQFVFVDFKGGATFDVFADLPHTLDIQTDLDGGGPRRTLAILDAELRRREGVLREAGVPDLADMPHGPPRLVVIVDELAAFVATHDHAGAALADIAQRGRSLGVHLVLATQRPAGAIGADVRANTALRIALRTEDAADARDVVGHDGPATIDRRRPGRAWVRRGGEMTLVQTANTAAPASGGCRRLQSGRPVDQGGDRELDDIVAMVRRAAMGSAATSTPRWPAALPEVLTSDELVMEFGGFLADDAGAPPALMIGVRDEPHLIRRRPLVWRPAMGPLLVHGLATAGAGDVLVAVARAVAARPPDQWHLEAIDAGGGMLRGIESWPHTTAVHSIDDREALRRLVTRLQETLASRRGDPSRGLSETNPSVTRPSLVLLIDGLDRLRARHDDMAGHRLVQGLVEAAVDGPELGVHVAVTTARPTDAPGPLVGAVTTRLVMTLGESTDHAILGQRVDDLPPPIRGRGYDGGDGMHLQVPRPGDLVAIGVAAAKQWQGVAGPTAPPRLPLVVSDEDLPGPRPAGGGWDVPVGLDTGSLEPNYLSVVGGEHLLVVGPARSGRTTLLRLVASRLAHPVQPDVVVVTRRPEEWRDLAHVTVVAGADDLPGFDRATLVLIEDAGRVPDAPRLVEAASDDRITILATGRPGTIRLHHARWLQRVRADRGGVLLRPSGPGDAALFEATLTGPSAGLPDGRGYVVRDGELLQTQFSVGHRP